MHINLLICTLQQAPDQFTHGSHYSGEKAVQFCYIIDASKQS